MEDQEAEGSNIYNNEIMYIWFYLYITVENLQTQTAVIIRDVLSHKTE